MDERKPNVDEQQGQPEMPQSNHVDVAQKSNKKRNMIVAAVVAVLVVTGGIVALTGNSDEEPVVTQNQEQTENSVAALAAAISLVEGNVQYSSDGENWTDATGGETVNAGDYVRTLAGGRTVLLVDDGSAVRLDGDTEVQLAVSDTMSIEIMLIQGQVYSRVVESESRVFSVVTENERFEAQGTAYKTVTGEFDTVEVYQSSVKVDSDEQMVEEGNKYDTQSKEKSDIDLASLSEDEFVQWNKQKDSESDSFKDKLGVLNKEAPAEPVTEPAPGPSAGISVTGQATDDGVKLSWSLDGVSSSDGFKLVRAKEDSTPTYGEDKSVYISNGEQRSYTIDLTDGKTYYFRVCIYRSAGGSCDTYSNAIQVTAPEKAIEPIVSGAVNLTLNGNVIGWTTGGTAPHGFKVVLSTGQNPTYPANKIQYLGAESSEYELEKPAGTYYVRVCKYTASSEIAGGCTDYSNQVTYVVSE